MALRLWHNVTILFCSVLLLLLSFQPPPAVAAFPLLPLLLVLWLLRLDQRMRRL
jgi:hypothetical protein